MKSTRYKVCMSQQSQECCNADGDAHDHDDEWLCVICQEETPHDTRSLPCGHKFHNTCLDEHFRRGHPECPMCRDNPYDISYDISYESDSEQRVTLPVALKRARDDTINRCTKRMLQTQRNLVKHHKEAMQEHRKVSDILLDLTEKDFARFKKKHQKLFEQDAALRANVIRAPKNVTQSKQRIARKYGWAPFRRRSRRRSRSFR